MPGQSHLWEFSVSEGGLRRLEPHSRRPPELVGGCRPVELLDFVSSPDWRVEFRDVVSSFGLSSEVLVAARV